MNKKVKKKKPVKTEPSEEERKKKKPMKTEPSEEEEEKKKQTVKKTEPVRKKKKKKVSWSKYAAKWVPYVYLITKMPLNYELWKLKTTKRCFQFP